MKRQKHGGRTKGTPNKRTQELTDRIKEVCGEEFDPVLGMAQLAQTELAALANGEAGKELLKAIEAKDLKAIDNALKSLSASKNFALQALSEVSQYVHAKRKAVEVSGKGGGAVQVQWVLQPVKPSGQPG